MKKSDLIRALKAAADKLGLSVVEQPTRNHSRVVIIKEDAGRPPVRLASFIFRKGDNRISNAAMRSIVSGLRTRAEESELLENGDQAIAAKLLDELSPILKSYSAAPTGFGFKSKKLRSKLGRY